MGVDPGIRNCGIVIVGLSEAPVLFHAEVSGLAQSNHPAEINRWFEYKFLELIREHSVDAVTHEALTWFTLSQERRSRRSKNRPGQKSMPTETMVKLGMVCAGLWRACREFRVPFDDYQPGQLKKLATGDAEAGKKEIEAAALRVLPGLASLGETKLNHAADAACAALVRYRRDLFVCGGAASFQ